MKKFLHQIAVKTRLIVFWRLAKKTRERGVKQTCRYILYKLSYVRGIHKIREFFVARDLEKIFENNSNKPVILSLSFIDWNVPLYQRPQHIAIQLAKQGFLYFYHTRNYYDYLNGYEHIGNNMYLTNRFD